MKLPDIPKALPDGLFNFFVALKRILERQKNAVKIITEQDLVEYGLINSAGKRLDDSGNPI